jgi:hypothetical protein
MKRHSLDVLSLVFGLIFLLVAGSWIVRHSTRVDLPDAGWYIAGALIAAGLFGIVSSLRGPRADRRSPAEPSPYESPYETPATDSTSEFPAVIEGKPEDRGF